MGDLAIALGDALTATALFGSVAVVVVLESMIPLRSSGVVPLLRWLNHSVLSIFNQWLQLICWPLIIALYSKLPISSHEGLLSEISAGPWVSFWVTLVSLEFVGYWWHRLSHFVPWLWRLHAVHHSDTEVDATTALRHHPGEVLLGSFVNLGVIMFLGTQPITALGCSLLSLSMDAFTHGNLSLGGVGRWLRYLLVTPNFHRVHHSATLPYTNRNFSNNFPLFDCLFGTAVCWSRQQQMTMPLGLEYFRERRAVGLDRLLLQPLLPHEIPKKGEVLREQVRTGKNT